MPPKKGSRKVTAKHAKQGSSSSESQPSHAHVELQTDPEPDSKENSAAEEVTETAEANKSQGDGESAVGEKAGKVSASPPGQGHGTKQEPKTTPGTNGTNSKKRKPSGEPEDGAAYEPEKATPKRTKRSTEPVTARGTRSRPGGKKTGPTHSQILSYLLSDAAADLCRPEDEVKDIAQRGSDIKTYSASVLSPFEELLCAVVLSRPISHRLGQRTIRTLLNDPYKFTTPKAITDAGKAKRDQAMLDAKTQHKDKTSEQIGLIAEVITSKFSQDPDDTTLEQLREEGNRDWTDERKLLKENIKGLGETGLNIFYRRVQWLWEEAFPFVDDRTARGLDKLGLPKDAEGLRATLQQHWDGLRSDNLPGDDDDAKQRRAFVIVCERATGADLERKTEELLVAITSS